jgi:hypothetical protein
MTEEQLQRLLRLKAFEHPADMAAYSEDMVQSVHARLLQSRLKESTVSILWERLQFWWDSLSRTQLALATVSALALVLAVGSAWTFVSQDSPSSVAGLRLSHDELILPAKAMTSPSLQLGIFEEISGQDFSSTLLSKHFGGGFSDDAWQSAIGETIKVRPGAPFEAIPDIQFGFEDEAAVKPESEQAKKAAAPDRK